jgi:hypothetical protein
MDADEIIDRAVDDALPHTMALTMALCEKAMANGIEKCVDTMRALADDIIAGRAPVTDIREAADYLARVASDKRAEAAKVLNRN